MKSRADLPAARTIRVARKGSNHGREQYRRCPYPGPAGDTQRCSIVSGHATAWACAKLLGAKVKTEILSDTVTITIPLELYVPDPQQIALRVGGPVDVKTGNPQTAWKPSPRFLATSMPAKLTAAITKALRFRQSASAVGARPIPGLDVTIDQANFAAGSEQGTLLGQRPTPRAAPPARPSPV